MIKIFLTLALLATSVAQAAPEQRFLNSSGSKVFCQKMGQGKPLVVVHGGPGLSQDYLLPHLWKLAEHNTVIFYDQRGCGQSTGEIRPETMNVATLVEDLENVRKELGFEKISILGHSWGGLLAMQYLIAHPDRVEKLILSNTSPANSDDMALFVAEWSRRTALYQKEVAELKNTDKFQQGDPDLHEKINRLFLQTYCHVPAKVNALNLRMSPVAAVNCTKINQLFWENVLGKPFDIHESLKAIRVPTLIVHGDDDVIPVQTAERIHRSLSGSKFVVLKNCGHFPYVEQPEAYFNAVQEFLNMDKFYKGEQLNTNGNL